MANLIRLWAEREGVGHAQVIRAQNDAATAAASAAAVGTFPRIAAASVPHAAGVSPSAVSTGSAIRITSGVSARSRSERLPAIHSTATSYIVRRGTTPATATDVH